MSQTILVRAPNWLGDAIMSMPFLRRLKETVPQGAVDVLCKPSLRDLFRGFPGIRNVLVFNPAESLLSVAGRIRKGRYDSGYVLPPSFSSAFLFFLAGIPERIGYSTDFRGFLFTQALPLDERFHYVRRYLGLLNETGADLGRDDFYFPVENSSALLPNSFLAVAPGSRAPARRWSSERFAELINGLSEKDWPEVVLLGSAEDADVAEEVASLCTRRTVNLCGKTSLAALGDLLRRCGALVTNESGMMHAAWAVGTPTVVIAGPSEPRSTSPFGSRVKILQHREVPCVPCIKNECYRFGKGYKECMDRVPVKEARLALEEITADSGGPRCR